MTSRNRLSLLQPHDAAFFERELKSFLPDRIFDAHCHVMNHDEAKYPPLPERIGYEEYSDLICDIHEQRTGGALFIPDPFDHLSAENATVANEWIAEAIDRHERFRGSYWILPGDDPEVVRGEVRRLGLHGLKCYHTTSGVDPTWEAQIPDYLPESFIRVADEEGWVITLHMVRSRGVADPGNIRWIRHYCENYPGMKLILAHSARGFQPAHNLEGLPQLVGLDNLYFDSSANCEPIAHEAVIRIFGHKKLMYGSDFFVSHLRGRSVAAADSFLFLYQDSPVWGEKHMQITPLLIGMENLRSLKWACWSQRLNDTAVEDIFWNNAAKLFGLE